MSGVRSGLGSIPDRLPFSYFNRTGELVGFDVEMAPHLSPQSGCRARVRADRTSGGEHGKRSSSFGTAISISG